MTGKFLLFVYIFNNMKHLKDIVYESFFDDDKDIMGGAIDDLSRSLFGRCYKLNPSKSHLIYGALNPQDYHYEIEIDKTRNDIRRFDPGTIKELAGIAPFQPLLRVCVYDVDTNTALKDLNVEWVSELNVSGKFDYDFSKLPFEVKHEIFIRLSNDYVPGEYIAYPGHLDRVIIRTTNDFSRPKKVIGPDDVKGWDCNELVVGHDAYYTGDFDREQLQKLIDNNPKVKTFVLNDGIERCCWLISYDKKRKFKSLQRRIAKNLANKRRQDQTLWEAEIDAWWWKNKDK